MNTLEQYSRQLNVSDETERIYAAEDIGYLPEGGGVPVLLERLHIEHSRPVRDAIFQALTRIEADAAIEGSVGLLSSDDSQIRNQAVVVLRQKGAASLPYLRAAMRDGDKDVRKLVLDVLIGFQARGTEPIYEAALSDPDANIVITAVENLGKMRAMYFRPHIESLLQAGSHPMLALSCLEALTSVGNQDSLQAVRRAFPEWGKVPGLFLASCLKVLGALGTSAEFAPIADLLGTAGARLRPAIVAALIAIHQRHPKEAHGDVLLPALRALKENGDAAMVRCEAIRTLGFLSVRDDVYSFLIASLSDPERLVRLAAVEALRMGMRPDIAGVLAAHAGRESDEEVLQAMKC